MKKIKSLLGLCLILSLVMIGFPVSTVTAYAQENNVVVTHEMLGDNDITEVVRLTSRVVEVEDGAFSGLTALKKFVLIATINIMPRVMGVCITKIIRF